MRICPSFRRFGGVLITLLSTIQPAWALGDAVVSQGIGFLVGGPILLALFIGLGYYATRSSDTSSALQTGWVGIAILGLLFNGLWLGLLLVFEPGTWYGWTDMEFVVRYALPNLLLVALAGFKGWPRRALAVAASCLLVGVGYQVLVVGPKMRKYEAARAAEQAAAPDGTREKPYQQTDQMPVFASGSQSLDSAIQHAVRYPAQALHLGAEGAVRVTYTVLPDGRVADVRAVEGIDAGFYAEAERVVKSLPPFLPGKQDGVPVAVAGSVNVFFKVPARLKRARLAQLERESQFAQAASWDDSAVTNVRHQWSEKE